MDPVWIAFVVGLILGGVASVIAMFFMVDDRPNDDDMPKMGPPRLPR